MRKRPSSLVLVVLLALLVPTALAFAQPPGLKVHSNDRDLVQSDGTPFFWLGDTNWRLYKLARSQVRTYLDDRQAKGFNVIQGPVLLHADQWVESTSYYGDSNTDPAHPDAGWFDHIDFIVEQAAARDMYVALVVVWGDQYHIFDSNSQAKTLGKWLGNRYKNDSNVIWIVAGEYIINGTGSHITGIWDSLAKGLREGCDGKNLITIHGSYQENRQSSSVKFHDAAWLDFNMIQSSQSGNLHSGSDNWRLVKDDLAETPKKPTIDGEAMYENLTGWDAFGCRRRAYWSVFAGAFGHTYGCNGIWGSYRGDDDDTWGNPPHWTDALDQPGAADMRFLRRLIESRPMLHRVPAQGMLLSEEHDVPDHIQVCRDSNGRFAFVYVPNPNDSFKIDMTRISGSKARAWWFNPRNGSATSIGTYATSGSRWFKTPDEGTDWVLVLDNHSKGYPKPGTGGPLP